MFRQLRKTSRKTKGNICGLWDCNQRIPKDSFLCEAHYKGWTEGFIDRCPSCGRFKEVMYQQCLDCYVGRPVTRWEPQFAVPPQKQYYPVEYSDAWVDGYMEPQRVFVYILEFDEGKFYVGHTKDIYQRLAEYRNNKAFSPAGRKPRLQYLELIATQQAAEARQAELKRLIGSNPQQIRLMIAEFHRLMREFGLEE